MSRDVNLDIGIAAIFTAYSSLILGMGVWGYAIIPSKCTNNTVHNGVRAMMIIGAVMLTAFLAFGLCASTCKSKTSSVISDKAPWWLLLFVIVLSTVCMSFSKEALNEMDGIKDCQGDNFSTWKKAVKIVNIIQLVMVLVLVVVLGSRLYTKQKTAIKKTKSPKSQYSKPRAFGRTASRISPRLNRRIERMESSKPGISWFDDDEELGG